VDEEVVGVIEFLTSKSVRRILYPSVVNVCSRRLA
jgi:hypothetical protein